MLQFYYTQMIFYFFVLMLTFCKGAEDFVENGANPKDIFYSKAYSIFKEARSFMHLNFEEIKKLADETETWVPPKYAADRYPYYLAGYDFDGRPVWMCEFGKFKWSDLVENHPENVIEIFEKYLLKFIFRAIQSLNRKDPLDKEMVQIRGLADFDGFSQVEFFAMMKNKIVLTGFIDLARRYGSISGNFANEILVINLNYLGKLFLELIRPVSENMMEKLRIFPQNPFRYKAELRRYLPDETIPTWYGGSKDFKPLDVYS